MSAVASAPLNAGCKVLLRCVARFLTALALYLGGSSQTFAHFDVDLQLNLLIYHIEHRADGLNVYARVPLPYLLADKTGALDADGLPAPAPFTRNALEGNRVMHYVDWAAVQNNANGVGALLEQSLRLQDDLGRVRGSVVAARVSASKTATPFDSLADAASAFAPTASALASAEAPETLYVGDAVADVWLHYGTTADIQRFSFGSSLNPGLLEQASVVSVVLDHATGGTDLYQRSGLLAEPVEVRRSSLAAFQEMLRQGVKHILEGLDHVLLVLCLTAGAVGIGAILWRVTGFTVGHSVTLSLGFFGFVPSGAWFIPTVEIAIAMSIVFAAYAATARVRSATRTNTSAFWITVGIGLLHGLGFSFVLQNILSVSAPDVWQSLLAFNLGIELGQIGIVLFASAILLLLRGWDTTYEAQARTLIAAFCAIAGVYWVVERSWGLLA